MRIIFDDFVQSSDAPDFLKTPALADKGGASGVLITFDEVKTFDAIGVGNTEAPEILVDGVSVSLDPEETNGLYMLPAPITASSVTISVSSQYSIGRLAIGKARQIGISPAREPGFWSTAKPRTTLSGQVIAGVGGVTGRKIQVDIRYKFTPEIFDDIERAFPLQIGRGFPLFLSFDDCPSPEKYPWKRLYAQPDAKWLFQSSVNRFLYSKKLKFEERF